MSYLIRTKYEGFSPDGRRTLNKGGGGGGSSTPYYANMDRLYGAQSRAAEYMLDQSMPVLPQYMSNSNRMVTEAMDGTLANQLRQRAGNDATATMGAALDANNRNMQRYGMGFSADRLLSEGNRNAIMGAAQKAGAMSMADLNAEDMKWNRNAGALGQATGMGTGAMQTMGQAAGGYGAAGHSMMQNDAANAAGYGQFGAALAKSAFRDGGEVQAPKRRGLRDVRLAAGGDPWSAWKQKNPITMGGPQEGGGSSALGSVMAGAAPYVAGEALKEAGAGKALKEGVGAAKDAVKGVFGYAPEAASTGAGIAGSVAPALENAAANTASSAIGATGAANGISGALSAPTLANAGTAAAAPTLVGGLGAGLEAGTGAGISATTGSLAPGLASAGGAGAAGSGLMATVGAAAPWLVGGYLLGDALGLFADGGEVHGKGLRRKDFSTQGGEVDGPGTEVSDSIPALLSDGEFVLNAGAVKLIGKDKLEQVNQAGLRFREDGGALAAQPPAEGGLRLAGGGFLGGNLGIALGAGVQEYKSQQEEARKAAAEDRATTTWNQQQEQYARQLKTQQARDAVHEKYKTMREALAKGDYSFVPGMVDEYNSNQGAWGDGHTAAAQTTPDGMVLHFMGQDNKPVRSVPLNRQSAMQLIDEALMAELKYAGGPEALQAAYYKDRDYGLKRQEVTDKGNYQQGILDWHNKQADRPQFMQDGTGRVLAISPGGKLVGTYGSPRPVAGEGGGGAGKAQPLGITDEGQMIVPDGQGGYTARPIMVNGKPATPEQVSFFKKLHGAGQPNGPQIPKEVITEYAKVYFQADPKTQQALKLANPELTAAITGGSGGLKIGSKGGKPITEQTDTAMQGAGLQMTPELARRQIDEFEGYARGLEPFKATGLQPSMGANGQLFLSPNNQALLSNYQPRSAVEAANKELLLRKLYGN